MVDIPILILMGVVAPITVVLLGLGYVYRTSFPMSFMWFLTGAIFLLIFLMTDAISLGYTDPLLINQTNTEINQTNDYGILYNGVSQYSQASGATIFDITTQRFSWVMDFKRVSIIPSVGAEDIFVKKDTPSISAGYALIIDSNDQLNGRVSDGVNTANAIISSALTTVQVGKNYSLGFVEDNTNLTIYLYDKDTNTLYSQSAVSSGVGSLTNAFTYTIARNSATSTLFCNCIYNNLRFIDNYAISQNEFLAISSGNGIVGSDLYKFDQNPNDSIGSNNLINFGNPVYTLLFSEAIEVIELPIYEDIEPILYDIKVKDINGNYTAEPTFIGIMLLMLSLCFVMIGILIERFN